MLSEERIKEAEKNVKSYLLESLMKKEQFNSLVFDIKLKNKEIFVVEDKGKYLGHIAFSKNKVEPPFGNSIFIQELAINKLSRGKGLGKELILALIKYCRKLKIPVIYLGTGDYRGNKTHTFYKKLGFKRIGKLDEITSSEYKYGQIFYGKLI